mmetsp:Transcript_9614/g.14116  ORF Transcript_9614/g.14116 Transcript_9614/m.14116 type:complete len:129 (-) Transcript_9614:228-614(-)
MYQADLSLSPVYAGSGVPPASDTHVLLSSETQTLSPHSPSSSNHIVSFSKPPFIHPSQADVEMRKVPMDVPMINNSAEKELKTREEAELSITKGLPSESTQPHFSEISAVSNSAHASSFSSSISPTPA